MNNYIDLDKIYTPQEIVNQLDQYIIGQNSAKRLVAISLRNRYRRMNTDKNIINSIIPKNILMIGPTGVGKTEIARRLSVLYDAPFIKVEATKFTEIGYVGKDVESIIKDLANIAMKIQKNKKKIKLQHIALSNAEDIIIEKLMRVKNNDENISYDLLKKKLKSGFFDERKIEIETSNPKVGLEIMSPQGMEEITKQLQGLLQNVSSNKTKKKTIKVKEALSIIKDEELSKLINEEDLKRIVVQETENYGIVFIDEIDKLTQSSNNNKAEISREGVQRDLLPLIEGSDVNTKFGNIKTDNILFIGSGSFHVSKPSDLLPELQGRLPVKVNLHALHVNDFIRILIEPKTSIIKQHQALLETEKINLKYEKESIKRIAEISWEINEKSENIGARRLYSVMEYLLEDISFNAHRFTNQTINMSKTYVDKKLSKLIKEENLDRFIL